MQRTVTTRPRPAQRDTTASLRVLVPTGRAPIMVKLFHDTENLESPEYGPYVFVQTMDNVMRGIRCQDPRKEEVIAELDRTTGLWQAQDRQRYTDVVTWAAQTS